VLYLKNLQYEDALTSATEAHSLLPSVESLQIRTKALFRLKDLRTGGSALRDAVLHNSCSSDAALELVEFCCIELPIAGKADVERQELLSFMQKMYELISDRWKDNEKTLVSQFRVMIEHELYELAIKHWDTSKRHTCRLKQRASRSGAEVSRARIVFFSCVVLLSLI
jgi:hypothetical protein